MDGRRRTMDVIGIVEEWDIFRFGVEAVKDCTLYIVQCMSPKK